MCRIETVIARSGWKLASSNDREAKVEICQSQALKPTNPTFLVIVSVYRDSAKTIENSWNFTGPTPWLEFLIV